MTKYRIASLSCSLVMVLAGALYLGRGSACLPYVLPILTACLWSISILQYLEIRAAGGRGIITLLPAIAMGLAAVVTTLATLAFFAGV